MLALVVIMAILLAWALVAGRLARWSITAPLAMVVAGVALTAGSNPVFTIDLETSSFEHTVEVVLAILLFVDATETPGGIFGREPKLTARLLGVALPLTLLAALGVGFLLRLVRHGDLRGLTREASGAAPPRGSPGSRGDPPAPRGAAPRAGAVRAGRLGFRRRDLIPRGSRGSWRICPREVSGRWRSKVKRRSGTASTRVPLSLVISATCANQSIRSGTSRLSR